MAKITIGFSRPKIFKPFAWVIMKTYNIPYDHVYVKFHSDSYSRDIIYQASSMMVNFMSPVIFELNNVIVDEFSLEISDSNKIKMMQFAIDNAGKPYGLMEALGLGIVRVAEIFGKTIKNPFKSDGQTYVCSVLAGYILDNYDNLNISADYESISPLMLHTYLLKLKSNA